MLSGVVQEVVLGKLTPAQSPKAFKFSQFEKPMAAFLCFKSSRLRCSGLMCSAAGESGSRSNFTQFVEGAAQLNPNDYEGRTEKLM
jgi:hypothetical protein